MDAALTLEAAGAPLLAPPLLDEAFDANLRVALQIRRGGEEEEKQKREEMELDEAWWELAALLGVPAPRRTAEQVERHGACLAVIAAAHKRKRKRRRKKKTPRTSSLSLRCRAPTAVA